MDCDQLIFFRYVPEYFKDDIFETLNKYIENIFTGNLNATEAPLLLKFNIDYQKWSTNKELRTVFASILNEPLRSQKDIETASWVYISSILFDKQESGIINLRICLQRHQIHCIIRVSNLPWIREFSFVPFRHPVRLSLSVMKCVLHSFDERCKYVRQSTWFCPKQCSGNQSYIFDGELLDSRKCTFCQENLQENEVSNLVISLFRLYSS